MRIERVVADASPLIILFKSGFAGLLPRLFLVVFVTKQVFAEVIAGGDAGPDSRLGFYRRLDRIVLARP